MDLSPYAIRLGCDLAAIEAIVAVESAGTGMERGRPVIRVEAHKLWETMRRTGGEAMVDAVFRVDGPKPWQGHRVLLDGAFVPYHGSQRKEWLALEAAVRATTEEIAIECTSWGLGQVMGAHWHELGFTSPHVFRLAQQTEAGQLDTMVRLIEASTVLLLAVRAHDWAKVARCWNGSGQIKEYAGRLEAAYLRAIAVHDVTPVHLPSIFHRAKDKE